MDQDSRKDFAFLTVAGQNVSVHTTDGAVWEGVFVATDGKASEAIVLHAAIRVFSQDGDGCEPAQCYEKCYIPMETVMCINAIDVKIQTGKTATEKVAPTRPVPLPDNLKSLKWDEDVSVLENFAEEEKNWKTGGFDQFKQNEKLGVKSTYDPDLYTTKLQNNYTPAQLAAADRLARDIESSAAVGIQQRIERGEDLDIDEGELYSDVKRVDPRPPQPVVTKLTSGKPGSYVPPAKRAAAAAAANASTVVPQQPAATVPPPQPVTTTPLITPQVLSTPVPVAVVAPKKDVPVNPLPVSPSASASEPKTSSLNVQARAWTPQGGATSNLVATIAEPPAVDFISAFTSLAVDTLSFAGRAQPFSGGNEWFPTESFSAPYNPNGFSGQNFQSANANFNYSGNMNTFSNGGYQANQQQGGYSSAMPFNNGNNQHQSQQSYQSNQSQPFNSIGFAGRGRGGGPASRGGMSQQPQQPTLGYSRGGGVTQAAPLPAAAAINPPQPLDSVTEAPQQRLPEPETFKKSMKRGR